MAFLIFEDGDFDVMASVKNDNVKLVKVFQKVNTEWKDTTHKLSSTQTQYFQKVALDNLKERQ